MSVSKFIKIQEIDFSINISEQKNTKELKEK